ncbi:anthrone oxygenase family protein [Mycobacterium timonense]|uniref:Membrane protein n=1 Tax=Mycobacterium timonense TaxID=701043 RepID=A0A7I9ZA30_9MYCO|nr:anthrone oxygenase family protein [Mycobacterium timonense]GFG97799.1 membrane protein [Mycobacterium timonense]
MNHSIDALAVVITGLMVGVELAVAVFFHPLIARLPDDAFRAARGGAARALGTTMPFWYALSLLLLVALAIKERGTPDAWLYGAAGGLLAVVVLLTVTTLVPINNRIAKWPATGELSRELAARWDRRHRLRVILLLAVFVMLTLAVI